MSDVADNSASDDARAQLAVIRHRVEHIGSTVDRIDTTIRGTGTPGGGIVGEVATLKARVDAIEGEDAERREDRGRWREWTIGGGVLAAVSAVVSAIVSSLWAKLGGH